MKTFLQSKKQVGLLFLGFFCFAPVQGQLRSELNLPRAGDELVKDRTVYREPGEAGENRTWDFTGLRPIDDVYVVHYFTRNDWKIIGTEKGKLSFLGINGDSLLIGGYETPSDLVKYHRPGLLLRFPVTYGVSSEGFFNGRGKHHDRLESIVSGEIQTVADASGKMILPGNDTLHNVIRVHIRKIESSHCLPITSEFAIDLPANDSLFSAVEPEVITTDTYQWYEEGCRYPVFETVETYRGDSIERIILDRNAYYYHPAEQAYLPEDTANQAALERNRAARPAKMTEKEGNILSFECYPNPVKGRLEIGLTLRKAVNVEVTLSDINGRLIRRFPSKTAVVRYRETLDVHALPPGWYVVAASVGNETVSEKIVKN